MAENWTCPHCHAYNPPRKAVCWQCGRSRAEGQPISSAKVQATPYVRVSLVFTFMRIGLLLATVGVFVLYRCRTPGVCETPSANQLIELELAKWLPPFLFVVILLLRYVEKMLMRRSKQQIPTSDITLHQVVDMVGICIASIIGSAQYRLPWLYLLVPITHYLFHLGIGWRKRTERPLIPLSPSIARQMILESQILVSAVALWPLPWHLDQIAIFFMAAFVIYQIRDWLSVVGVLDPLSAIYRKVTHWMKQFAAWGPIGLRFLSVCSLFRLALGLAIFIGNRSLWENPAPEVIAKVIPILIAIVLTFILVFLMMTLGIAGRVAAVILLLISTLFSTPTLLSLCTFLLVYLGTGKLSLWTEDKLLTRWLAQDLMVQYPDEENVQRLQNVIIRQDASLFEKPMEWQEPFKLSKALKTTVKVGTVVLVGCYTLYIAFSLVMAITFITHGPRNVSDKMMTGTFSFLWILGLFLMFVFLGFLAFYFVHIIKNTAASSVARVIFGIGIYAMPAIAMPIYYWTYIRCNPPPLWARKTISVEPTPGDTPSNTPHPFSQNQLSEG